MNTALSFDYSAWSAPLDPSGYRAFVAGAKAKQEDAEPAGAASQSSRSGINGGIGLIVIGGIGAAAGVFFLHSGGNRVFGTIATIVMALMLVAGIGSLLWSGPRFLRRWRLYFRATRFADANAMEYFVQKEPTSFDGMVFQMKSDAQKTDYVYSRAAPGAIEAGQLGHTYKVPGDARRTRSRLWGYIAVELPTRAAERAMLRSNAKGNENALALHFAESLGPAASLTETHTLYCPPATSATARAVFTPDVVSRLQALERQFSPVNAELVANHLYVFTPKPFDMYDAKTVRLVFDTIAAVRAAG